MRKYSAAQEKAVVKTHTNRCKQANTPKQIHKLCLHSCTIHNQNHTENGMNDDSARDVIDWF